jgi:hypothetical protein
MTVRLVGAVLAEGSARPQVADKFLFQVAICLQPNIWYIRGIAYSGCLARRFPEFPLRLATYSLGLYVPHPPN